VEIHELTAFAHTNGGAGEMEVQVHTVGNSTPATPGTVMALLALGTDAKAAGSIKFPSPIKVYPDYTGSGSNVTLFGGLADKNAASSIKLALWLGGASSAYALTATAWLRVMRHAD